MNPKTNNNFGRKKKQRNTETHNSSKANKAREERAVKETEEQRKVGGRMTHGRKRGEQRGGSRDRATVRMEIYKYVRLRDDWVTELRKERKPWQKKKEKEEGLESRGMRKGTKRSD